MLCRQEFIPPFCWKQFILLGDLFSLSTHKKNILQDSLFLLIFVLSGYDGHNHDNHIKCPRKPLFGIQSLCHDSDWLLDMDFKQDDNHGLAVGAHPKCQLSEDFLNWIIAKICLMPKDKLYAVSEGKYSLSHMF